jgi:hypothetical protein
MFNGKYMGVMKLIKVVYFIMKMMDKNGFKFGMEKAKGLLQENKVYLKQKLLFIKKEMFLLKLMFSVTNLLFQKICKVMLLKRELIQNIKSLKETILFKVIKTLLKFIKQSRLMT